MTYLVITLAGAAGIFLLCAWLGRIDTDFWSISIFSGTDLQSLGPHPRVGDQPVLSAAEVTDTRARFVADPFLLRTGADWHMFFEVYAEPLKRGVISHATSSDGVTWKYDRVVLQEPFHLSYPHVFEHAGQFYMTPESNDAGEVRLYRADAFPGTWRLDSVLLRGRFYDPTLLQIEGRWWMWVCDEHYAPLLFTAAELHGPWGPHACNAHARPDPHFGRPGGRMLAVESRLVRFVQDSIPTYGSRLHARVIDHLGLDQYAESAWAHAPLLDASGQDWRATGMHHLDACRITEGWIAAVDGNRQRRVHDWRYGARIIQRWMLQALRKRRH